MQFSKERQGKKATFNPGRSRTILNLGKTFFLPRRKVYVRNTVSQFIHMFGAQSAMRTRKGKECAREDAHGLDVLARRLPKDSRSDQLWASVTLRGCVAACSVNLGAYRGA